MLHDVLPADVGTSKVISKGVKEMVIDVSVVTLTYSADRPYVVAHGCPTSHGGQNPPSSRYS